MTYIEAFTHAKDKKNPGSNEDRLVSIPDRLYAVIDGATDKSGRTYDGLTGGQIAARIVEDVLRNVAQEQAEAAAPAILNRVNRRLRRKYRALGMTDLISSTPWCRFSAQASIVIRQGRDYRCIVVGDTGLRINGSDVFSSPQAGDVICAQLRAAVHRCLIERGVDSSMSNKWARAYTVDGLANVLPAAPGEIGAAELDTIREAARAESRKRLPDMTAEDIDAVLMHGLKGLHRYRNRPGRLGFPSIDGSPIPPDMIIEFRHPAESIESLEIFSDGYPGVPNGTNVTDWEEVFWQAERDDPDRVSRHPGTKGSTVDRFADDRTVLIVRPQAGTRP